MTYNCSCGHAISYWDDLIGQASSCPKCGAKFTFPKAGEAPSAPPAESAPPPSRARAILALDSEDVHLSFSAADSAYVPSGERGNRSMIFLHALIGLFYGVLAMAGLVVGSILVNVLHNILPVFIFLLPILILGMLALAPAVLGMVVGKQVAGVVLDAKSRNPGHVGRVSCLTALAGLAIIPIVGSAWALGGGSFFSEIMIPFVRLMVGASISFEWSAQPEPVNVPAWIIYGVFGLSAFGGLGGAYFTPSDRVSWTPYCERCGKYMGQSTLWKIPPVRAQQAAIALETEDFSALKQVPYCTHFKNRLCVELWQCACEENQIVELVYRSTIPPEGEDDEEEEREPVRVYARPVSKEQVAELGRISADLRY